MPDTNPYDTLRSTISLAPELSEGAGVPLSPHAAAAILDRALGAARPEYALQWTCLELVRPALVAPATRDEAVRARLQAILGASLGRLHGDAWAPESHDPNTRAPWGGVGDLRLVAAIDLYLELGGVIAPSDAERLVDSFANEMSGVAGCRIVHHPSFPIRLMPKLLQRHWVQFRTAWDGAAIILTGGARLGEFLAHRPTRTFLEKRLFGGGNAADWPISSFPANLWAASMTPHDWPTLLGALSKALARLSPWAADQGSRWDEIIAAIPDDIMTLRPMDHPALVLLRTQAEAGRNPLSAGLMRLCGAAGPAVPAPGAVAVGRA